MGCAGDEELQVQGAFRVCALSEFPPVSPALSREGNVPQQRSGGGE